MTRILRSIAMRFPLLLGAIVIAVALVTGRLAQQEIGALLIGMAQDDLRGTAEELAGLLGRDVPTARAAQLRAMQSAPLREVFAPAADDSTPRLALERHLARVPSTTRAAARVLKPDGIELASWSRIPGASAMGWTIGLLREGLISADSVRIGPMVSIGDTMPGYVVVAPVHAENGTLLGFVEEVHVARGVNVAGVRALVDVERLLVGSRNWPVWTDLHTIVPGPVLTATPDSVQRVLTADGTPVIGVGREVPGTAWVVWVERPEEQVLAPVDRFLRRMWLATLLIALTGAMLAWLLSRYLSSRIRHVAVELDRTLTEHRAGADEQQAEQPAADELRQLEEAYAALEERLNQRRRLDEQIMQAQKLEAVGRLAGGIAHDFNNLLTVMASYAAMARENLDPRSPEAQDLDEVAKAVERATALTRQLLAFSRQRISDTHALDINDVVRNTDSMLARLIPSNVERVIDLAPGLPLVAADPTQLEQVLVNLVVNAVDAMPEGGRVTVRTSETRAAGLRGTGADGEEEACVCLSVTDTGVGMDAATMARVFDPFFTTKPKGKGTGLGLATVHGIAEALGGRIVAYSEVGHGTSMRLYLPIVRKLSTGSMRRLTPVPVAQEPLDPARVLLAEDDVATRSVIKRILETSGHRVEAHETADAALAWLRSREATELPDVVITDVMMPGLNGIAFTKLLRELYPTLPVILISGYSDVADRVPDDLTARPVILEKPFTATVLLDALRRALRPS